MVRFLIAHLDEVRHDGLHLMRRDSLHSLGTPRSYEVQQGEFTGFSPDRYYSSHKSRRTDFRFVVSGEPKRVGGKRRMTRRSVLPYERERFLSSLPLLRQSRDSWGAPEKEAEQAPQHGSHGAGEDDT